MRKGKPMIIAILEDIPAQAELLTRWIANAGHQPVMRHDGNAFLELIGQEHADMLLLDWDVPGKTGIEILHWARAELGNALPILMLTQHDSESDIVYALDAGADDYVIKPLRERELVARMQAQLRKYYPEAQGAKRIEVGDYVLDATARVVTAKGRSVELGQREFDIAVMLFSNIGRIVSKDVLLKKIWGNVDRKLDPTLATYVSKLRTQLVLRAKNGLVVSTIYNYGYRLERV